MAYRPISVIPVVVKVFEKLVHKQLYNYLNTNGLLDPAITQDVLLKTVDDWRATLDLRKVVGAVMINLSKVFYSNHQAVLQNLNKYGVWGVELQWFTAYLHQCRQCYSVVYHLTGCRFILECPREPFWAHYHLCE